jgi:hypothetical protein
MSGFRRALAWLGVVDEEDDVEEVEEPISGGFDREVQDTERRVRSDQPAGAVRGSRSFPVCAMAVRSQRIVRSRCCDRSPRPRRRRRSIS